MIFVSVGSFVFHLFMVIEALRASFRFSGRPCDACLAFKSVPRWTPRASSSLPSADLPGGPCGGAGVAAGQVTAPFISPTRGGEPPLLLPLLPGPTRPSEGGPGGQCDLSSAGGGLGRLGEGGSVSKEREPLIAEECCGGEGAGGWSARLAAQLVPAQVVPSWRRTVRGGMVGIWPRPRQVGDEWRIDGMSEEFTGVLPARVVGTDQCDLPLPSRSSYCSISVIGAVVSWRRFRAPAKVSERLCGRCRWVSAAGLPLRVPAAQTLVGPGGGVSPGRCPIDSVRDY